MKAVEADCLFKRSLLLKGERIERGSQQLKIRSIKMYEIEQDYTDWGKKDCLPQWRCLKFMKSF